MVSGQRIERSPDSGAVHHHREKDIAAGCIIIADADVTNVFLSRAGNVLPIDGKVVRLWPDLKELSMK
jgi:hypothetical protein